MVESKEYAREAVFGLSSCTGYDLCDDVGRCRENSDTKLIMREISMYRR